MGAGQSTGSSAGLCGSFSTKQTDRSSPDNVPSVKSSQPVEGISLPMTLKKKQPPAIPSPIQELNEASSPMDLRKPFVAMDQEERIQERSPLTLQKLDLIDEMQMKGSDFGSLTSVTSTKSNRSDASASKAGGKRVGFADVENVTRKDHEGNESSTVEAIPTTLDCPVDSSTYTTQQPNDGLIVLPETRRSIFDESGSVSPAPTVPSSNHPQGKASNENYHAWIAKSQAPHAPATPTKLPPDLVPASPKQLPRQLRPQSSFAMSSDSEAQDRTQGSRADCTKQRPKPVLKWAPAVAGSKSPDWSTTARFHSPANGGDGLASATPSGDWAASGRAVTPTRNMHGTLPSALKQSSSLTSNSRIQREISGSLFDASSPTIRLQDLAASSRRANTPTRSASPALRRGHGSLLAPPAQQVPPREEGERRLADGRPKRNTNPKKGRTLTPSKDRRSTPRKDRRGTLNRGRTATSRGKSRDAHNPDALLSTSSHISRKSETLWLYSTAEEIRVSPGVNYSNYPEWLESLPSRFTSPAHYRAITETDGPVERETVPLQLGLERAVERNRQQIEALKSLTSTPPEAPRGTQGGSLPTNESTRKLTLKTRSPERGRSPAAPAPSDQGQSLAGMGASLANIKSPSYRFLTTRPSRNASCQIISEAPSSTASARWYRLSPARGPMAGSLLCRGETCLPAVANSAQPNSTSQGNTLLNLKIKQRFAASANDNHSSFHDQRAKTPLSRRELSYGEVA